MAKGRFNPSALPQRSNGLDGLHAGYRLSSTIGFGALAIRLQKPPSGLAMPVSHQRKGIFMRPSAQLRDDAP